MTAVKQWVEQERSLWIAWLLFVPASLVLNAVFVPPSPEASLGVAVYCAYLLLLMRYLRGTGFLADSRLLRSVPRLGPWGYIWRSYVVLQISVFALMWASGGFSAGEPGPLSPWLVWLVMLIFPPVVTWLGFGRDPNAVLKRLFRNRGGNGV